MSDTIREKISKLLNMTVENGCSEDEQESAMRIAAGLAARAGIELDSVRPKDQAKPKAKQKYVSEEFKPHQALCAEAAAVLYGVECSVYNLGAQGVAFVGRDENIELAEKTWFWLMRQVEHLYKQHLPRGLDKRDRAEFRKSFKAQCAVRVRQRANALVRDMMRNDASAQAATGHNALVVLGHFDALRMEINEYWEERWRPYEEARKREEERLEKLKEEDPKAYKALMKEKDKYKPRMSRGRSIPNGYGGREGYAAGDNVKLREEVR